MLFTYLSPSHNKRLFIYKMYKTQLTGMKLMQNKAQNSNFSNLNTFTTLKSLTVI